MAKQINKQKALGELFELVVKLNDIRQRKDFKHKSSAFREVVDMMDETIRACMEAIRNGHPLMFEINVWEQLTLTGWAITTEGRAAMANAEEVGEPSLYGFDDSLYGSIE